MVDTSELLRVFGPLNNRRVNTILDRSLNSVIQPLLTRVNRIRHLKQEIEHLKLKTMVLKGLLKLVMNISILFARLCSFWNTSTTYPQTVHSPWWKFWKKPDRAMLQFCSPAIPGSS
jgi:hypothetical protein